MPKHIDNVPKLDTFRPPWITEDGTEVEINKDTLKKWIHNLLTDKAKALDSKDEAAKSLEAITAERDDFKGQVDGKDPDAAGKIAKLEQKVKDAEAKVAKAELALARTEIAVDKGLTPNQAKRLQGDTREELEADADELVKDLGIKPPGSKTDDDDDEDEEDEANGLTTPKSAVRLTNSGDAAGRSTEDNVDYDAAAAQIQGNSFL